MTHSPSPTGSATRRVGCFAHERSLLAARLAGEAGEVLARHGWELVPGEEDHDFDVALVLGGDGTLLRAAEALRGRGIPILGVNVGHMGFLSESDPEDLPDVLQRLTVGDYRVEDRATVSALVVGPDGREHANWALNEVTLEKTVPQRIIEVRVVVDGRPVSTFGCDGIVLATPTGSTGHAFSGGGPVVWPEVEALLMVPISAHALFARPLVVSPQTVVVVEVLDNSRTDGQVSFDGRRTVPLPAGGRLEVRHSSEPVQLVRFGDAPFADRLVHKFALPVTGWRRPLPPS